MHRMRAVFLGLWVLALLALAPVPPYRPKPEPSLLGEWKMLWRNASYRVALLQDGRYECCVRSEGPWETHYIGRWFRQGTKLRVEERRLDSDDGRPMLWTVELKPGTRTGTLEDGSPFALTATAGR